MGVYRYTDRRDIRDVFHMVSALTQYMQGFLKEQVPCLNSLMEKAIYGEDLIFHYEMCHSICEPKFNKSINVEPIKECNVLQYLFTERTDRRKFFAFHTTQADSDKLVLEGGGVRLMQS